MSDFPASYITSMTRTLRSAIVATESPFSFVQQIQDYGGERWEFDIEVIAEGRGFEAFANAFINKRLPFTLTVPRASERGGTAPVLTAGAASARASQITASGTWNGRTLKAGDFISLVQDGRHRLHQLTQDASSASPVLQLVPRLRSAVTAGVAIEVVAPKVTLRSTGPAPAGVDFVVQRFSIKAVEML